MLCRPTIPRFFRAETWNTHIFFFGLRAFAMHCMSSQGPSASPCQHLKLSSDRLDAEADLSLCCLVWYKLLFLAHLSRRLTRWAYRMGLVPASVRPSVSNMNISETSRPITTKFYLKHHWGGGKAALGFDADQIRTLVSMETDSSHRVIMGKRASSRFLDCFWSDPFYTCR